MRGKERSRSSPSEMVAAGDQSTVVSIAKPANKTGFRSRIYIPFSGRDIGDRCVFLHRERKERFGRFATVPLSDRSCGGASDDITGGVVSSDAALSGSWVAYKPVVLKLPSTVGFYKLPEWAGSRIGCGEGRIFKS